ncbi:MAG: phage tail protein [Moraxella sp.]|nr:phage tail protein [Moraxella sp.]
MQIIGAKKGNKASKKPHIQKDTTASVAFFKGLHGLCEGEIAGLADGGKSIRLDGTPIINANGTPNFEEVKWSFRSGTLRQEHIAGFPSVENETAVNVELRHDRPFIKYFNNTQLSAVRVRLNWNALRQAHDNGDVTGYRIDYAIDVQSDGGSFVQVLNTCINDKTSQGYKRSHRIDLPSAKRGWSVRVRRLTANADSELISDKMTVDAVTEIIDAKLTYPCTALLGLEYDAQIFSSIAKLAVRLRGKLIQVPTNYNPETRQYTGLWDGTFKLEYSNNPAWVYYDLCTHKRYGLGERLAGLVDKWSLYRLAQYCDALVDDGKGGTEPRFTCNVYLQKAEDAYQILQNIASIFRAMSYWNGEQIVVDSDVPKEAVYTFSRANVVGGEFSYTGTRTRDRHSVIQVGWDNPDNDFKTEYEFVRDEAAIAKYGIKKREINAFGCTSRGQATRVGKWALLSEQLETRTVQFKTGLMGFIPQVGQVINIADDVFAGRAISGQVLAVSSNQRQITLDRPAGKAGDTLMVNGADGTPKQAIVTAVRDNVLSVAMPLDVDVGAIWAIVSDDLRLMQFRVMAIKQNDDASFDISALQYERSKFGAADTGARLTQTPYSVLKPEPIQAPQNVSLSAHSRVHQGISITTLNIAWTQVKGAVGYIVQWRKDDGNWVSAGKITGLSHDIEGVYAGNYMARVRALDAFDNESLATSSQLTHIAGKTGRPPRLARLTATGLLFAMRLEWVFNKGSGDTAYTEIQVSPDGRSNIATLGQFAYPTNSHTINGLQGNLTQHYRARIVDKLGNTSEWTAWVSGTTDAQADKVLDLLQGQISQSQLHKDLSTPIGKILPLEQRLGQQIGRVGSLEQSITSARDELNQNITTLQSNLTAAKNTLEQSVQNVNRQLGTLNQSLSAAQNNITTTQRELNTTKQHLTTAQNTLNTAVANITTERNRISSAIRDIGALQSANNAKTQQIANLTQTVNGHTSSIRELGVTTGDLSQKYSQIKTQADKSTSEITAIKQTQSGQATSIERLGASFDGLSVGGRNLLRNSQAERTVANATTRENFVPAYALTKPLEPNTAYVLSYEYKTTDNAKTAQVGFVSSVGQHKFKSNLTKTVTWQKGVFKFTTGNNTNQNGHIRFDNEGTANGQSASLWVKNVKLELGSVPSDYTPAPEDVQTDIDQKASSANLEILRQTLSNADTALSQQITAMDTAYKSADRTLSTNLASEISARTSADTALGQRIDRLQSDYNGNKASVANQLKTLTDKDTATATQISQITANVNTATTKADDGIRRANNAQSTANTANTQATQAKADIVAEQKARSNADSALSSRINALDSKFTTADNTIKASIATAQQTATNAQQALATAQSQLNARFDNLNIGARNYLSDSKNLTDSKLWLWGKSGDETLGKATQTAGMLSLQGRVNGKWKQWCQIAKVRNQVANAKASDVLAKMEVGKTYTLSFEAKASNDSDSLRTDFREHYAHNGNKAKNHLSKTWQISNQWVRYHATFVFNPINISGATLQYWGLYFIYFGTSEIFIRKPKLELGNTPTDYTEAPEDIQTDINAAKSEAAANLNTMRETLATADSALGRRIDAVSAEFKQADNTIKASVQAETQARTNADNALSQRINALDSAYKTADNQASARISQLEQSLASKDAAMARRVDGLQANYTLLDNRSKWTELTSTQDLNNLTTQGNYFIRATNNTNAPHNGWLYVRVDVPRADRLTQTAWADNNPSLRYMRTRSGTTWHGWQKQATGSELDSKASSASLTAEQKARADADSALSSRITALDSAYKAADAAMRASITNAQQTATNAQQALATAQSQLNAKIDGINVGGRNLLIGSHATRSTHGTTALNVSQNIDFVNVRQLVLSCDVKYTNARRASTQGAKWFRIGAEIRLVWTDGTSNWYGAWRANVANAGSFHGRVALKISVPAGKTIKAIDNAKIQIWDILGDGMLVKNAKLEIGNVATDWTPAPEDTSTATSALQAKLDEFKSAQATKDNATTAKLSQLESNLNSKANASALNQTNTKVSQAEGRITAEANKVSTLQTTVGQHTASIQQQAQSINGLRAQWTLKVESGGIVSGIGLASANGKSAFAIRANQFYVADPTGTAKRPMFSVLTSPQTINGVTVPAGTYISSAYIQNGSITTAKIGHAQIDTLQVKDGAIIVPRVQYNAGFRTFHQSNEIEVGRITIDAKGGNVMIGFGFQRLFSLPNGAYSWGAFVPAIDETNLHNFVHGHVYDNTYNRVGNVSFHIRRNGVDIHNVFFRPNYTKNDSTALSWLNINRETPILLYDQYSSPAIVDNPPSGNTTYTLLMVVFSSAEHFNNDRNVSRRTILKGLSFSVMGVKR